MATTQHPIEPALRPDVERALHVPLGAASPLWFAFLGVAASASAWWWMTRWARDLALDGASGAVAACAVPAVAPEVASFAPPEDPEPRAHAVQAVAEAAGLVVDPVIEAPVAVTPEPSVAPPAADDLTRMIGIGPKLAAALAGRGVTTFAQIAAWQGKDLDEVDRALNLKGRAVREAWVSQARKLAAAD